MGSTDEESGAGDTRTPTQLLAPGEVPAVSSLVRAIAQATPAPDHPRTEHLPPDPPPPMSITSAADAMRDEEVERTRMFIRMGWLLSLAAMGTVPFLDAPPAMSLAFCGGMVIGMIVSFVLHRAFADPRNYTERALLVLAVICVINGNIGVLYYGTFSAAPLMVVVGIHFVARTEAERVARWIFVSAIAAYTAISAAIISGAIDDPGVFASDRAIPRATLATASIFVLGTFAAAYYTARMFRAVSLASIEDLRRATRLGSAREALMDELRADLERALAVGGPGRYSGQLVAGYRLGVVIGRGAMGEVYEAAHAETNAEAAVKLLRRELLGDGTTIARFLREVRASMALDSPHVVRVLEAAHDDAPMPYLVMERLRGQTLAERLRVEARLGRDATVELCRHAAAALDVASAAGIVHRDLKPQNLMLEGALWKVLDFGVATLGDDTGTLTQGGVVGTPHYMAPEQARGQRVDGRADLYALAAIVYRCATGRHLFHGADTPALLYAVVHRMPARPSELAPDLPPDLDRWCALALAKLPDERFPTGAALVAALEDAYAGKLDGKLRRRADALIRRHPWELA
ncbi:MAG: serine/threonine protein kinase [Deltaproteobacteria bacterium]|nr:serine/threonine protein kinase [Deltaproteobacteria bacterium]MCW5805803.1 serine/threonine protein kinase [Deltaproteobacteria bacterium]